MTRPSHAPHTGTLVQSTDGASSDERRSKPAEQSHFQPTSSVYMPELTGTQPHASSR